ncbi:hypothetical protein KY290_013933 [Solanum tuberosum]|uniref:DM2 domain-containing protein n=1 Tax=Solanum tuberosum TaxID=4113 RepID=A0ABQ7VQZ4_SOLTU|nr:hypothetical protein KY284_015623 [Solanum tuberosum]KAH0696563.1 hypothetical protein KY289_014045 [Solanum tuberosum]KAH0717322.1 hypothetical protein KY285_013353 [Solanum tuberosum]KAH0769952.1 hypothetical protein KY290_013933 [Solanum tuberosum]
MNQMKMILIPDKIKHVVESNKNNSKEESVKRAPSIVEPFKRYVDFVDPKKDPSDERQIICDEKLKELFHVETHRGIGVMKLLSPHFIKAEG